MSVIGSTTSEPEMLWALDQQLAAYLTDVPHDRFDNTSTDPAIDVARWDFILGEVSQTLLPRCLVFEGDHDDILSIDVANRHVLGIAEATGPWVKATELLTIGTPLSDPIEVEIAALAAVLVRFTTGRGAMNVKRRRGPTQSQVITGVSVNALRPYGLKIEKLPTGVIDRFIAGLGTCPDALLLTRSSGEEHCVGDVSSLVQLRSSLQSAQDPDMESGDQVVFFTGSSASVQTGPTAALLIAYIDGVQMLCQFHPKHIYDVATVWLATKSAEA